MTDAIDVVRSVGIRPRDWKLGKQYLACPWCKRGPRDDRLTLWVKEDGHATWCCNRCGEKGSTYQCDKCNRWLRECICGRPRQSSSTHQQPQLVKPTPPTSTTAPAIRTYGEADERWWDKCLEITADCPVGRYLSGRACALPYPEADLRWIEDWRYPRRDEPWSGPCMVGRITHALTGEPQSFHFTWIRPDGGGKAPLAKPRLYAKGMVKAEGVIRLSDPADDGGWLLLGEGIETVLSSCDPFGVRQAWATLDAGGMKRMPIPSWVETFVVLADHDKVNEGTSVSPGLEAAAALVTRIHAEPRPTRALAMIPPEISTDWNDVFAAAAHAQLAQVA